MIGNTSRLKIEITVDDKGAVTALRRVGSESEKAGKKGKAGFSGMGRSLDKLNSKAVNTSGIMRQLVGVFALYKTGELVKDTALLAARYETLGVVMHTVGKNVGYSTEQVDRYSQSLRENGISMVESRQNVARMIQAHIDLANANKLARIAQDAAVIGNINSSEAFGRMIYGIQSAQVEMLRTIGINVNFEQSYNRLAKQLGKNAKELTRDEKALARVNVVMEAGKTIAGNYEAAMETSGKQIKSMERYIQDFEVKAGEAFGPTTTVLVKSMSTSIKDLSGDLDHLKDTGELDKWAIDMAHGFLGAMDVMLTGIEGLNAALRGTEMAIGFIIEKFSIIRSWSVDQEISEKTALRDTWQNIADAGPSAARKTMQAMQLEPGAIDFFTNDPQAAQAKATQLNQELSLLKSTKAEWDANAAAGKAMISGNAAAIDKFNEKIDYAKKSLAQLGAEIDRNHAETSKPIYGPQTQADADRSMGLLERQINGLNDQSSTSPMVSAKEIKTLDNLWSNYEQARLASLPKEQQAIAKVHMEYDKYREAIDVANDAGKISVEDELNLLDDLDKREQEALDALAVKTKETTNKMSQYWIQAERNMVSFTGDVFYKALTGQYDSIGAAFEDMLTRQVSQYAAAQAQMALMGDSSGGGIGNGLLGIAINAIGGWFSSGSVASTATMSTAYNNSVSGSMAGYNADESLGQFYTYPGRAIGGSVAPRGMYEVNEDSPEVVSVGGRDYLMMGSAGGSVQSAARAGVANDRPPVVQVNVLPAPGTEATVQQSDDGMSLDVIITKIEDGISNNVQKGTGSLAQTMEGTYGLNRAAGAY